jgi:hypothetical protein
VYQNHLEELRRGLYTTDASVVGPRPELPTDVAPRAAVRASSECCFNDQEPGAFVPVIAAAGLLLWDWPETFEGAELYLRNSGAEPISLCLRIHRATAERKWHAMDDYHMHGRNDLRDQAFAEIVRIKAVLPPGHDGWFSIVPAAPVALGAKDGTRDDDRLLISLDEAPGVEWGLARQPCEIAAMVEHSHHAERWLPLAARPTLKLMPPPRLGEAVTVIDGCKQRLSRAPLHLWLSSPDEDFPQDLTLTWEQPQVLTGAVVIFDNLCENRQQYPWEEGPRALPILVKSYELAVCSEGAWRVLVRETDNVHRFRSHAFADAVTAEALRLRVLETHGGGRGARVYEIRALTPEDGG